MGLIRINLNPVFNFFKNIVVGLILFLHSHIAICFRLNEYDEIIDKLERLSSALKHRRYRFYIRYLCI